MKKILFFNTFIVAIALLFSCESPGAYYSEPRGDEVTFPASNLKYEMVASDNNSFKIEMWRGNSSGALSVPVIFTMEGDTFTPQSDEFHFNDGESIAYLQFDYDDINNFEGETYTISVTVADPRQVSIAGINGVKVTLNRKFTYLPYAKGTFYSEILYYGFEEEYENPMTLYKAEEGDYFRFYDLYETGYNIDFSIDSNGNINFDEQSIGVWYDPDTPGYGMFHWGSTFLNYCEYDPDDGYFLFVVDLCLPAISHSFGKWWEEFEIVTYL